MVLILDLKWLHGFKIWMSHAHGHATPPPGATVKSRRCIKWMPADASKQKQAFGTGICFWNRFAKRLNTLLIMTWLN